jgi:hypothetical protein
MLKACVGVANAGTVKKCVHHRPSQKKKRQPLKPQSMLKAAWLLAKKPAALDRDFSAKCCDNEAPG